MIAVTLGTGGTESMTLSHTLNKSSCDKRKEMKVAHMCAMF